MISQDYLDQYGITKFPKIAGSYNHRSVVVCGDASCIWEDLERFGCRNGNEVAKYGWDFMTVNRLVETFPGRIDHAFSNVAAVLNRFVAARRDEYEGEFGPPLATHSRTEGTDFVWPWNGGGTSGLGAILTCLVLGYRKVVLAGMPLNNGPHNGEPPWRTTRFTVEVEDKDPYWKAAIDLAFEGRVKSLSGRTRDWLGEPSR